MKLLKPFLSTVVIFTLLTGSNLNAQGNSFFLIANSGISTPLLEEGIGFHIGLTSSYSLTQHLAVEGQVSYVRTNIKSAFISGRSGIANTCNLLAGARLYFNSEDKKVRPCINLLLGGMYNDEEKEGLDLDPEFGVGLSLGTFVEINKLILGVSFDTPGNIIFKVGYRFSFKRE
jgi:hypothetical protein